MKPLPSGWATATLGLLAGNGQYGWTTKACAVGSVRFLRTTDITKPAIDWIAVPYCAELPTDPEKYALTAGDIVISRAGSVGFSKLLEAPPEPTLFASYLIRFKPTAAVHPPFLANYLRSNEYWQYIGGASAGIALANVNASSLAKLNVPVPPMAEQKRIADKLDTVLTRVDAVSARLARVAPILKRFRQSVLATATSGRLTEDWRIAHRAADWVLRTVDSLCLHIGDGPFGSNLKSDDYVDEGARVVRLENIGHLSFDAAKETFISLDKYETLKKHTLIHGDLLFSSFVDEEVRVCEFPADIAEPTINKADCFCIRVDSAQVSPRFLAFRLACKSTYQELKDLVHGATRPRINLRQLRGFEVMLPSTDEQTEIVRRVQTLFAFADRLEARLKAAQTATGRLTPALLAKAFRGELVPQDPNDEPASELLRRLQAASGHRAPARAAGRGRKRSI